MKIDMGIKEREYPAILGGEGENDYTRYMRTDVLLSLQRCPQERIHRDELLFQIVHQSTELWLKLSCNEVNQAIECIKNNRIEDAVALIVRGEFAIQLITKQLEMLKYMTPWDFQGVRPALGNGSGLESPGWIAVREVGTLMENVFEQFITEKNIDLVSLYKQDKNTALFSLCEALIDWDENVALWRTRHYKVAVRTIGHNSVGTKGMPVDKLAALLNKKFFPMLWDVRSTLSGSNQHN